MKSILTEQEAAAIENNLTEVLKGWYYYPDGWTVELGFMLIVENFDRTILRKLADAGYMIVHEDDDGSDIMLTILPGTIFEERYLPLVKRFTDWLSSTVQYRTSDRFRYFNTGLKATFVADADFSIDIVHLDVQYSSIAFRRVASWADLQDFQFGKWEDAARFFAEQWVLHGSE